MLNTSISIVLIAVSVIFAFILIMLDKRSSSFQKIKVKRKTNGEEKFKHIYAFFSKIPVFSWILKTIEGKLSEYSGYVSYSNKKTAFYTTLTIVFVDVILVMLFILYGNDLAITIGFVISLIFIDNSIIDYVVTKTKIIMLANLVDFLDIYRTKYFESGNMPDDALLLSVQSLDDDKHQDIIIEIERIYETVSSPDADILLSDYYQASNNNYFKLFSGLIHLIQENGDTRTRDGMAFAKGISWLSSEIKDEIILRDKLNFSLKSLNIISLVPIFVMTPLKNWASRSFYPLEKFYSSELGFQIEMLVIFLIVITYVFLSKVQKYRVYSANKSDWIDRLLEYTVVKKIISYIKPSHSTLRYRRIMALKEESMTSGSIDKIYLRKLLFSLVFLCLSTAVVFSGLSVKKHSILYDPTPPNAYLGGELVGKDLEKAILRSEKDRRLILAIDSGIGSDEISSLVDREYVIFESEKQDVLKRIMFKYQQYKSATIGFWHILAIYIITVFGYLFYNFVMKFTSRMLAIDSLTEIAKYQLIILILVQSKCTEVEDILIWMERFSVAYKVPINKAIMDYDSGRELALKELKSKVKDEELKKIIDHMISAENNISIENAFSELEGEKKYYEEKRRIIYNRIIDKKIGVGKIVGFVPIYSLILIYFMLPLTYVSVSEMEAYFDVLI